MQPDIYERGAFAAIRAAFILIPTGPVIVSAVGVAAKPVLYPKAAAIRAEFRIGFIPCVTVRTEFHKEPSGTFILFARFCQYIVIIQYVVS